MPPKKPAADTADPPAPSSSEAPVVKKAETNPDVQALRKLAAQRPSTTIMVKEALKELDSRKGVSSQAIQNYIKQKYPSVDVLRLKHLVRRALKKGLENGTLVRPASSSVATGAVGKFRLAPKVKESKKKTENTDPNVQEAPKPAKDEAKKPKKAGATKKEPADDQTKSQKDPKPHKQPKEKDAATSKVAPAKKPKGKTAAEKGDKSNSGSTKTKGAKSGKESQSKAAKDGDASKTTGKRGKKAEA
ncbi:linker histone H1M [Mastacembelus armatus]|uniref:linker histone H1M n=1 Tax=Mastacembelus armatus TaxID=205130 RepID=UPI000E460989|nr:protein B4-like [Mastacembelus armatus]